jgi:adenosylcobinamide-phosphate synthase
LSFSLILLAAFALDQMLGDPLFLPHPVRWMGRAIEVLEPPLRRLPLPLTVCGGILCFSLVGGTFILATGLDKAAGWVHPAAKTVLDTVLIYYCISAKSLEKAAMQVWQALRAQDLIAARKQVARIVGRETERLSGAGVVRAAVETVAENLVDGFVAPIFFAALGGAPLAVTYKMVNTLDSMVGYKNDRYLLFGKVSARLDDIANFIPARLAVPVIALAAELLPTRSGLVALKTAWQDGARHASPNSGYAEAAFAGVLMVRLGGPNIYHGCLVEKPFIGRDYGEAQAFHIPRACDLMLLASVIWLFVAALGSTFFR